MDGAPIVLGSTVHVPVPPCAAGPNHCDARRFEVAVEACVGASETKTCSAYTFDVTVPGASAFGADDATLALMEARLAEFPKSDFARVAADAAGAARAGGRAARDALRGAAAAADARIAP